MRLHNLYKHTLLIGTWVLCGILAASCSHEAAWESETDEALTRGVSFNIPLSASDSVISNLQIFLYDSIGAERLAQVEITAIEEQADGSQMIHGLVPVSCPAINGDMLDCHMVILGNCPETDGNPQLIQSLTFEANAPKMPMVGSRSVKTRMDRRLEVLCPTTDMLRSGAMVTVRLGEELIAAGIALKGAKLLNGNQTGFCTPDSATRLNTSDHLATATIFRPDSRRKGDLALQPMADGTLQGLVPECATPAEGPLELHLDFLRNGIDYTGSFGQTLYFKNYADNVPFDLVRNHHYLFTIRSLQTDGELEVIVEEWEQKTAEDVIFK